MRSIEIRLFGGFQVLAAGGTELDVSARKARAVLASLALAHPRSQPRDWLATMFWGDVSADEQAKKSLRQALTALRKALPNGVIEADRDAVSLARDRVTIDVERFVALLDAGDHASIERAVASYRGDLLEEFSSRVDAFDDWILPKRQALREQAIDALGRLLSFQRAAGQLQAAVATAIRQVSLDPLREASHRSLMRLFADMGRTRDALRQYEVCRSVLGRELNATPSIETRELCEQIRAGRMPALEAPLAPMSAGTKPAAEPKAQLRLVTVLAAVSADPAAPAAASLAPLGEVVREYAGHVLRAEHDSTLAVFGSKLAKQSDPWRAVSVCRALLEREPGLGVSFGIAHAMAMVTTGEELSVTGTVLGSAMRLASRAGAREIVASDAVARVLGERASFEPVTEGSLGVAGERAYRFVSADNVQRTNPFIGRARELRVIALHLEECQLRRRGSVLCVRADPGLGKSRLVEQVTEQALGLGFATHRTSVVDFGPQQQRDTTGILARSLLSDVDALDAADDGEEGAGPLSSRDEQLLWELCGQPGSARPVTTDVRSEALSEQARLARRRELWIALVEGRARRRPTLIAIDDLHWADEAALEDLAALVELVDRVPLVLLLATRYQEAFGNAGLRGALRGRPTTTIDLAPFDRQESLKFLGELGHTPASWLERAAERAGGNPLFLAQLLRARSETALPESMQATVQLALDEMDSDATWCLKVASVLGQRFQPQAVRAIGQRTADFSAALERGLVRRTSTELCFSHALVRDAVYATLLAGERRELHLLAAGAAAETDPVLAAEHLERAGESSAALAWSKAAAHHATRGKVAQALAFVERGLALAADIPQRFALTLQRSELLLRLGQSQPAIDACHEALTLARDDVERLSAWLANAEALRVAERNQETLEALNEAERLASPRDPATLAQIYYLRGSALFPLGNHQACLEAHAASLKYAERSGSVLARARAESGLGDAHYIAGRLRTAAGHFRACVELCDREGFTGLALVNRAMIAIIQFFELRCEETLSASERLVAAANEAFDLRAEALALNALLFPLRMGTDYERIFRTAERTVAVSKRANRQRISHVIRMELVWVRALRGDPGDFDREADQIYAQVASEPSFAGLSVLGMAVFVARTGERLLALLDEADRLIEAGQYVSHALLLFVRGAVLSCVRQQYFDRALGYAELLERYLEPEPLAFAQFYLDLARAAQLWRSDVRAGAEHLSALREQAKRHGLLYDAGIIDQLLASRSLP
ncbi:MAG TPA: BTAD domain-containing putative transcriptional regulator [Polyangiaceae bacterium]